MREKISTLPKQGGPNDEDEDYESRINSFYDWFIFDFHCPYLKKSILQDYIEHHKVEDHVAKSLLTTTFSLFEFSKINFRKKIVLEDLLHKKKVVLTQDKANIGLIEKDLFVGHYLTYQGDNYLLSGLAAISHEIRPYLTKEIKRLQKINQIEEHKDFLLKLKFLRNKMKRYAHVHPKDIFQFN